MRISRGVRRRIVPYVLILPTLMYLGLSLLYPVGYNIWLSFHRLDLLRSPNPVYVGPDNYKHLLLGDPNFWSVVVHTLFWVAGSTILQLAAALPAAVILHHATHGRSAWRGFLMVPWVTPVVVAGIMWRWIFDGEWGVLNFCLQKLGLIRSPIVWLGDAFWAWPALLLTSLWKGMPYVTLMLLAGLQSVPDELLDAAAVDGAGNWTRFWRITFPQLYPVVYVSSLVTIVTTWTKFDLIWVLTQGGPGFATSILPTYVYTNAFMFYRLGMGATVATVSVVLVVGLAMVYVRRFQSVGA